MGERRGRGRTPWWRGRFVRWVLMPYLALRVVAYVVYHFHPRPVIDRVTRFNRDVLNPAMLRRAGGPHWYAARLEHVGRRSGRAYATPVVAAPVHGGLAVPLPYGTDVDWLRNALAAGRAVVVLGGVPHEVSDPVVMTSAAIAPQLSARWRLASRLWGYTHWLRVSTTS